MNRREWSRPRVGVASCCSKGGPRPGAQATESLTEALPAPAAIPPALVKLQLADPARPFISSSVTCCSAPWSSTSASPRSLPFPNQSLKSSRAANSTPCAASAPSFALLAKPSRAIHQRNARHPQWIKNYDFSYRFPPSPQWVDFTVTAVAGHLMSSDFEKHLKGWQSCDPFVLFDAQINHFVNPVRLASREELRSSRPLLTLCSALLQDPAQKGIEANLIAEAKKASHLLIWTDCDREGEHIGSEVAQVCRKANPRIIVKRARFSAIIAKYSSAALCYSTRADPLPISQPDQPRLQKSGRPRHAAGERRRRSNGPGSASWRCADPHSDARATGSLWCARREGHQLRCAFPLGLGGLQPS